MTTTSLQNDSLNPSRRKVLVGGAGTAAVATVAALTAASGAHAAGKAAITPVHGTANGGYFVTARDGTQIFYKDWGSGQPVVFSHGWPLNADAWDEQLFFLAEHGYRTVAHDRRGHGRSSQPWDGNDLDQYADDLAELIEKLDLRDVVLVGHST